MQNEAIMDTLVSIVDKYKFVFSDKLETIF